MLHTQTLEKLNQLKLFGMVQTLENYYGSSHPADISPADFLSLMVDAECTHRENKRMKRLVDGAKFKEREACLEGLDYKSPRGLKKTSILELVENQWISHHQNILITGPSGSGKSYLAQALGNHCARFGYSVNYVRMPKLIFQLLEAKTKGTYLDYLKKLAKVRVLILDDWGLCVLSDQDRQDLLEIVEDRHKVGSTILTSQLPVPGWHAYLGGGLVAEAILDRLFHSTHRFDLQSGDSLRKEQKKDKEKLTSTERSEK